MKKILVMAICIFILSSIASAISSDLKVNYELGETIIAEIKGNILEPIGKEQIDFKRGHVSVPFEFDFKKIGNRYFLWAIAPEKNNNYTLVINDIATIIYGKNEKINFEQNFSVSGNLTDYSIKPGFINTKEDFKIEAQLNKDDEEIISSDFPSEREINLKPGKNSISFSIADINENKFVEIKLGKYLVPAYIIGKKEIINESIIEDGIILEVNPIEIRSIVLLGDERIIAYPFQIFNRGDKSADRVSIDYDIEMFSIAGIENISLNPNGVVELNVSYIGKIDENIKKNGVIDTIVIKSGDFIYELPIIISFTENETNVETPYLKNYTKLEYCSELNGKICTAGDSCNGKIKQTIEGQCCVEGACVVDDGANGGYSWIGWLIGGIVLVILIYSYLKYKKTKGTDEFGRRISEAENKMKKNLP